MGKNILQNSIDRDIIEQDMIEQARIARIELARRELAKRRYRYYLAYVHREAWVETRMAVYLADRVQAFLEAKTGNARDILVIETPPQHGKSMTISETLPSWILGRFPRWRIIEISYNDDSARRFGRKNLEKVEEFGRPLFGIGKGSIWTKEEFEIDNGWGRLISRGVESGITGNPANVMIIDDPIKNQMEADSITRRESIWKEWQSSYKTRLAAGAKVIIIMTPWHEDDFAARVIKMEPHVDVIRLPVEAGEDDPLGREPGEALCPELGKGASWVADMKQSYLSDPQLGGARAWTALYMCSPRVEGGNILQRAWWQWYNTASMTGKAYGTVIISVDAAFKGKENNDFVAIQVWGRRFGDYYLLYGVNRHLSFFDTVAEIRRVRALFPDTSHVVIEDKANGPAIIEALQREMTGVIGVTPKGDKVSRVNAVQAIIEGGHAWLPDGQLWVEDFVEQCSAFPAGKHDDMVDAMSQALVFLLWRSGGTPPLTEEEQMDRLMEKESRDELLALSYDPYSAKGTLKGGADYVYD